MSLVRKYLILLIVVLALGLMTGCVPALEPAIQLDSNFQPQKVDLISILPPVDARLDKKEKVNLQKELNKAARSKLKKKRYKVQLIDTDSTNSVITKDDLETYDAAWIKKLGPGDANWVMVLVLDDVVTKLSFGSTGNAEVSGFLFDKQSGTLLWRDKGVGKTGMGGLAGMMMIASMDEEAIRLAVIDLIASIPKRPKN
jgi:hypothetical protein